MSGANEPLLKAEDVARLLNVSRATVHAWALSGRLPSVVLHRTATRSVRRWRAEDVRALMSPEASA